MAEPEEWTVTPEEIVSALVHELRQPIRAAIIDAEVAAKGVEGTMVDLTRAITRFRRCQGRIRRHVDSLRWLPALLRGDRPAIRSRYPAEWPASSLLSLAPPLACVRMCPASFMCWRHPVYSTW